MKITLTESEFVSRFLAIRPDNFSREALRALFEHLGELEREMQEEMEFDPVAICCEWSEYSNPTEAAMEYGFEPLDEEDGTEDESQDGALTFLREQTTVLELSSGGVVILNF
jgi:hypothetical protein